MTDHYDEMRVAPDPAQAEALRLRLYARVASGSPDVHRRRSDLDPDGPDPMKELNVTLDVNTSETGNRRRMTMAVAAAVAVVGVTGIALVINNANADDETTTATAVATAAPNTSVAPATSVAPTTTVAPEMETIRLTVANGIPVTFTAPDDWTVLADGAYKGINVGLYGVTFPDISNVYTDGCTWELVDPPVGPTVDDLVAAWSDVPELQATAAVDVTVDGYAGKQIELTVPDYRGCRGNGLFGVWQAGDAGTSDAPAYYAQGTNEHLQMSVLDVDGTRLVIGSGYLPDTSPQDRALLEEVVASIQIG